MIWSVFNKPAKNVVTRSVIIDLDGLITPIDDEYRDMGVKEKWLRLIRAQEWNGEVYLVYRLTCPTFKHK